MTLVVGATGQLALHLRQLLPRATFLARSDADLADPRGLKQLVERLEPTVIINAAAYTAVDRAEKEPDLAWRVNAEAPAALATVARERDIPMVQVSTDYVFDGAKQGPYVETDPVAPLGVYGASKLGGELAVRSICPKHWIVRTSWVFSEYGTNFVKTMVHLGKERSELNVVADQRGRPTYAGDLAKVVAGLIEPTAAPLVTYGTYHAAGGPALSWYEFATRIMDQGVEVGLLTRKPTVRPIPSSEYPTPAKRPINSVMQSSTALDVVGKLDWERGLESVLTQLK